MGQYLDYKYANRDDWKFSYTAKELIKSVDQKYKFFTEKEAESRKKIVELLSDLNIRATDKRVDEVKNDIENYGSEREKCIVWIHEFNRKPSENYNLMIGDIVYFNLPDIHLSDDDRAGLLNRSSFSHREQWKFSYFGYDLSHFLNIKCELVKENIQEYTKCKILHQEFLRNPGLEYSLKIGDVTYFDIAKLPS